MKTPNRTEPLVGYILLVMAGFSLCAAILAQGGLLQAAFAMAGVVVMGSGMAALAQPNPAEMRVAARKRK